MILYFFLAICGTGILLYALISLVPAILSVVLWIIVAAGIFISFGTCVVFLIQLIIKAIKKQPKSEIKQVLKKLIIAFIIFVVLSIVNNHFMPIFTDWCASLAAGAPE